MTRNGAAALRLDWKEVPGGRGRGVLRLATPSGVLRGPDKYRLLELKRRRAQIRARRLLGLID